MDRCFSKLKIKFSLQYYVNPYMIITIRLSRASKLHMMLGYVLGV